ncbi:malate synthase A [Proteus mirabilis]|nr:malate synthase A [Proteus mirabilis]
MSQSLTTEALSFTKPFGIAEKEILNHYVESFLTDLVSQFSERRDALLAEREIWKQKVDNGMLPDFIQNQIPL